MFDVVVAGLLARVSGPGSLLLVRWLWPLVPLLEPPQQLPSKNRCLYCFGGWPDF